MGFQKGQPRPANAGRKKGVPNKKKVLRVADVLAEKGVNPIEKILDLMPFLEPKDAAKTWLELQSYCQVKPKDDEGGDGESSDENILEQFKDVTDATILEIVRKPDGAS